MREAVTELRHVITAFRELITRDYPTREETDRKFVKKDTARKRIMAVFVTIAIAFPLSLLITVSTISTCFLNGPSENAPDICNNVPGFAETTTYNKNVLRQFNELIGRSETNEKRIKKLEERAGIQ